MSARIAWFRFIKSPNSDRSPAASALRASVTTWAMASKRSSIACGAACHRLGRAATDSRVRAGTPVSPISNVRLSPHAQSARAAAPGRTRPVARRPPSCCRCRWACRAAVSPSRTQAPRVPHPTALRPGAAQLPASTRPPRPRRCPCLSQWGYLGPDGDLEVDNLNGDAPASASTPHSAACRNAHHHLRSSRLPGSAVPGRPPPGSLPLPRCGGRTLCKGAPSVMGTAMAGRPYTTACSPSRIVLPGAEATVMPRCVVLAPEA